MLALRTRLLLGLVKPFLGPIIIMVQPPLKIHGITININLWGKGLNNSCVTIAMYNNMVDLCKPMQSHDIMIIIL